MKPLIVLIVIGTFSGNIAAEGLMDRQGLIKVVKGSFETTLCNKTNNTCMGVTQAACLAEAKKIVNEKCTSNIPGELENMNELSTYLASTSACVVREYNKIHNDAIVKNREIPDCQAYVLGK